MADFVKSQIEKGMCAREDKIVEIFCFFDESLKFLGVKTPKNSINSYADILVIVYLAYTKYSGNVQEATYYYFEKQYGKPMNLSRIYRLIALLKGHCERIILQLMSSNLLHDENSVLLVDSMPFPLTQHKRKSKRLFCKEIVGFNPHDNVNYIGVKVHMICTLDRKPVFLYVDFASKNDITTFKDFIEIFINHASNLQPETIAKLQKSLTIIGDKAYNDEDLETILDEDYHLHLTPIRKLKKGALRESKKIHFQKIYLRKAIETSFSMIKNYLGNTIKTRTFNGFLDKIRMAFVIYAISCSIKVA
jgi:hypothetical protein